MASHFGKMKRVAGRLRGGDVAEHCRHADNLEARIGKGHVDGHRIVDSRVRVDDDFLRHDMIEAQDCEARNASTHRVAVSPPRRHIA